MDDAGLYSYAPSSPTPQELQTIAFLCGYEMGGDYYNLYNLIRRCVSLGPQGWGLALFALTIALSNGNIPYSSYIIPPACVGRVSRFCVIDPKVLFNEGITDFEGIFTATVTYTHSQSDLVADTPDVFAVCVTYEDMGGKENFRCVIVRRTDIASIPFISTIPSDTDIEKLRAICASGGNSVTVDLTGDEYDAFFARFGRKPDAEEEGGAPENGSSSEAEEGEEDEFI